MGGYIGDSGKEDGNYRDYIGLYRNYREYVGVTLE